MRSRDGAAATAGYVRPVHGPVPRLWKKADSIAPATREATTKAAEAAEQMKVRAGEVIAMKRQILAGKWNHDRMTGKWEIKKAVDTVVVTAVASKKSTATATTSTSVEERRAAVDRISKQVHVQHSDWRIETAL